MNDQVAQFKCPSCGSPIRYVPGSESLTCANCGNTYPVDVLQKAASIDGEQKAFDWGDYKKQFTEQKETLDNTAVYICRSCGAQIECEATTVATHCPYCDNEVVLSDRVGGGIRPNAVIPFAITADQAKDAVLKYFEKKKLLPNDFRSLHKLSKIKGIYVPFWLFDSDMDGRMQFDATRVRHYSDKDYDYTETQHYLVDVSGDMRFEKVPVDGSEKADDDLMDALEPFDYKNLIDFNEGYLSGFMADRFDEDPDASLPRAERRMRICAETVLKGEADDGFDTISEKASAINVSNPSVKYALLPVYLLNIEYKGKNYRFAVNGQTGKVVGELPISKAKKALYFWRLALILAAPIAAVAWLIIR